jgi:flagellar basal body rod protein FlgG
LKPNGLQTGAQALRYWQARQQVVANNLANAETSGFKGERVFARLLGDSMVQAQAATDMRAGSITVSGGPLDLAIEGEGYFVVGTQAGERLTRGGSMRMDSEGRLADSTGNLLLGDDGPIVIPHGTAEIEITTKGEVRADGTPVGTLRMERAGEGARLEHEGGVLFSVNGARAEVEEGARRVRQGALEASNVNTLESMVDMIDIQRAYAAVNSSIKAVDGMMETIANQIGRVS